MVWREPCETKARFAHPDLHGTLRDASAAAQRHLKSYKGTLREDAVGRSGPAALKQVAELLPDAVTPLF